jgi:hypothetical protein
VEIQIPKGYPKAFDLPQADDLEEFYRLIVAVQEHLTSIDVEWAKAQPDRPRGTSTGWLGVPIPPNLEGFAAMRQGEICNAYRNALRVQLGKLWNPAMPSPPLIEGWPEVDLFNVLLPWVQKTLSDGLKKRPPANAEPAESARPKRPNRLERALQQYQQAIDGRPQFAGNYPAAYRWFREHLADDPSELPVEDTWINYVRKAMKESQPE